MDETFEPREDAEMCEPLKIDTFRSSNFLPSNRMSPKRLLQESNKNTIRSKKSK